MKVYIVFEDSLIPDGSNVKAVFFNMRSAEEYFTNNHNDYLELIEAETEDDPPKISWKSAYEVKTPIDNKKILIKYVSYVTREDETVNLDQDGIINISQGVYYKGIWIADNSIIDMNNIIGWCEIGEDN